MEPHIRQKFNPQILQLALQCYDLNREYETLDGFESFIFKVSKQSTEYILRIGHTSRRTADVIQGEAEFLRYLFQGGLSVPQVLTSINNNLVEPFEANDGSFFIATLFEKAPGDPPEKHHWQPSLYHQMGRFMGRLHNLSKDFAPSQPQFSRHDIEQDFTEIEHAAVNHLPAGEEPILHAYQETINTIRKLPKDEHSFGLCHVDFHGGNFFLDENGKITLFDFDDCQYAWFVYDIAMALFYAISHDCSTPEALEKAASFLTHFWQGYQVENQLGSTWLLKIPLFLRLREIDLAILIHRSMDMNDLDPWCDSYMDGRHQKIIDNTPYCDIDYEQIAASGI